MKTAVTLTYDTHMVKVTESSVNEEGSMSSTVMQSLILITFRGVRENRNIKVCLPRRTLNRPDSIFHASQKFAVGVTCAKLKYVKEDSILNAHANMQTVASEVYRQTFKHHWK